MGPADLHSEDVGEAKRPPGALAAALTSIRNRIVSGLIGVLPIVLTFWIISWLYSTLRRVALDPAAQLVNRVVGTHTQHLPPWWDYFVAPLISVLVVLLFLYFLGLIVSSWVYRVLNWLLLHVPIVTQIYKALTNLVRSLQGSGGSSRFRRVVLVEFPQPGLRSLAFVTNTLTDHATGKPILCVCVLTGVMPPSGFTLFVPEESVTDVDWTVNQTIQAILSGGITTPGSITYFQSRQ